MVNTCQQILKTGPNKGMKCCEARKVCRHNTKSCICGFTSNYATGINRHMKKCEAALTAKKEEESTITAVVKDSEPAKEEPSGDGQGKGQGRTTIINNGNNITNNIVINDNRTVTFHNYQIAILAPNFYKELEEKQGHDKAMKVLVGAAKSNRPIDVLKALYFSGSNPNEYPIASRNGRYRYLNDKGQIVESGAVKMNEMLSTRIQKAMSYATGMLIKEMRKTVYKLYDTYDLGRIQSNICYFPEEQLKTELHTVTENPTHPFFMDGVLVLHLE